MDQMKKVYKKALQNLTEIYFWKEKRVVVSSFFDSARIPSL